MHHGNLARVTNQQVQTDGCNGVYTDGVQDIEKIGSGNHRYDPQEQYDANDHPAASKISLKNRQLFPVGFFKIPALVNCSFLISRSLNPFDLFEAKMTVRSDHQDNDQNDIGDDLSE